MLKILSKREKAILFFTISIFVFSFSYNFLLEPVLVKNELLNREIMVNKAKLQKYIRLLKHKEYLQAQDGDELKFSQEGANTVVALLKEIEELAKKFNIRIIDIRPQIVKEKESYKEIPIELRAEGSMEGYAEFIYNIEKSLLLLKVKKIQLNTKPNSQVLEGNFSILQLSLK